MTTEHETFAELFGEQQDKHRHRVETRRQQKRERRASEQERDDQECELYALGESATIDGDMEKFKEGLK